MYREASNRSRVYLAKLNSEFQQSLWGLLVIKVFQAQDEFNAHFAKINQEYIRSNNKYIAIDASFSAVVEFISILSILLVVIYVLSAGQNLSAGEFVAFISYSQMLFQPVQSLSEKFGIFQSSFTAIEKVKDLLDEQPVKNIQQEQEIPAINSLKFSQDKQ